MIRADVRQNSLGGTLKDLIEVGRLWLGTVTS